RRVRERSGPEAVKNEWKLAGCRRRITLRKRRQRFEFRALLGRRIAKELKVVERAAAEAFLFIADRNDAIFGADHADEIAERQRRRVRLFRRIPDADPHRTRALDRARVTVEIARGPIRTRVVIAIDLLIANGVRSALERAPHRRRR